MSKEVANLLPIYHLLSTVGTWSCRPRKHDPILVYVPCSWHRPFWPRTSFAMHFMVTEPNSQESTITAQASRCRHNVCLFAGPEKAHGQFRYDETWRGGTHVELLPSPIRSTPSWLGVIRQPVFVDHTTIIMLAQKGVSSRPQDTILQPADYGRWNGLVGAPLRVGRQLARMAPWIPRPFPHPLDISPRGGAPALTSPPRLT